MTVGAPKQTIPAEAGIQERSLQVYDAFIRRLWIPVFRDLCIGNYILAYTHTLI